MSAFPEMLAYWAITFLCDLIKAHEMIYIGFPRLTLHALALFLYWGGRERFQRGEEKPSDQGYRDGYSNEVPNQECQGRN